MTTRRIFVALREFAYQGRTHVRLAVTLFATAVAFLLVGAPFAAEAERVRKKVSRIGYLSGGSDSAREAAFRQGLRDLGYIEGQNVTIEYRFAEGKFERLPGLAAELVRLNVDLIVSSSTPANHAAYQATQTIPIVTTLAGEDPRTGSIPSLARPGGNMTGLTTMNPELIGKRLELLREALPRLSRVALLRNRDNPLLVAQLPETEAAARALGLQTQILDVRGPQDLDEAFKSAVRGRADALLGMPDTMLVVHRKRLAELAIKHHLPTMYQTREHPDSGSLMSYGPDVLDLFRRAASYVDRILKGAKPGDLPIERPTKFELVINLQTAKVLGLVIPRTLLLRADQVIE